MTRLRQDAATSTAKGRPDDAPLSGNERAAKKKGKAEGKSAAAGHTARPREVGGRDGLDPTRYGDWENNGRCVDF